MRKSIVTKYFCICSVVILACVICIGSVLLLVASQFYKTEKKEALIASVNEVIAATKLCYLTNDVIDTNYLNSLYKGYAASTSAQYALIDQSGNAFFCSEPKPCIHSEKQISQSLINGISDKGYFEVGNLSGFYQKNYFIVILPFKINSTTYYVAANMPAESLGKFLTKLLQMFFVTTMIILMFVLPFVYFAVKRLLSPIKEMTTAARRYAKGDFTKEIPTTEDNEIGILAATLNDMAYSLSTLESTRKSFIANVSHELKTPMTTIGGFVDGILDGTIPKDQHKHYLQIVSDEVSRLSRLVRSMLNIAKYETGEMELKMNPFDITALTVKTVLLFEKSIDEKQIEIQGLDSEKFYVMADIDLIQQILYNLVENAVKFVNKGGCITFDFSLDDDKTTISIRNSGEGLTQAELPKVFDRFYKTDESHGKDKTGVGLGLAIVRSIINLHGGNILVKSALGEYTEFSFTLLTGEKEKK